MTYKKLLQDEEVVRFAVENSQSLGKALDLLGVHRGGKTYRYLRMLCEQWGIDCSFPSRYAQKRIPFDEIFIENSPYVNNRIELKKRLYEAGIFEEICIECGNGPVWNGKPLVLQLDHINGVNNDHRIENLRIMCPNCHTQTETYAGKRRL